MILLDTNVMAEIQRESGESRVKAAVARRRGDVWLSAVALGEIHCGLARLPDGARRRAIAAFFERAETDFAERILGVDAEVARRWGLMRAGAERRGRPLPLADGLIAATALVHDVELWTRNTRDFAATGARVFNPWEP